MDDLRQCLAMYEVSLHTQERTLHGSTGNQLTPTPDGTVT